MMQVFQAGGMLLVVGCRQAELLLLLQDFSKLEALSFQHEASKITCVDMVKQRVKD